ncbi:hypothetical protein Z043_125005, partial [Scleropages formosus]
IGLCNLPISLSHYLIASFNPLAGNKIPIKLSNFHKRVLLIWTLVYKHNFSPHKYVMWNNRDILYKHKSLFFESWVKTDILLVKQLFNSSGQLIRYDEFMTKYKIAVTPKEFGRLFDVIPSGVIMLFRNQQPSLTPASPDMDPCSSAVGQICFSASFCRNNRAIRAFFQRDIVTVPYVIPYWNIFTDDIPWIKVGTVPVKFLLTDKVREVSYKSIHKMYPNLKKTLTPGVYFVKVLQEQLSTYFDSVD